MVSGAQGMGGGPQLPPTIRESETRAFVEVTKKYILAMVSDSMNEVIPFTQREYDELFKYRSEASKPSLHGLLQVRSAGPQPYGEKDESWQQVYQELFKELPDNVRGWLAWELNQPPLERDPDFVAVNQLVTAAAKLISWLSNVAPPVQINTPAAENLLRNVQLPYITLKNVLAQSETVLKEAGAWINSMGSNHVSHDVLSNLLGEMRGSLDFLQNLKQLIKEGPAAKVQEKFIQAAFELNRLSSAMQKTELGGELQILSTQLSALSKVVDAWAIGAAPSPLSIGAAIATIGLTSNEGISFGGTNHKIALENLLNGIIGLINSSTQSALQEMQTLHNDLAALLSGA